MPLVELGSRPSSAYLLLRCSSVQLALRPFWDILRDHSRGNHLMRTHTAALLLGLVVTAAACATTSFKSTWQKVVVLVITTQETVA
jgi:hypothetical protein